MFYVSGDWLEGVAFLLPPLLVLVFGFLVPFSVKLTAVTFGSPSRPQSFSSYMTTLYFWLLMSTLIFPIVLTGGASNLLDFGKELNNGGFDLWREKWQCVFAIDTGMFYIRQVPRLTSCGIQSHVLSTLVSRLTSTRSQAGNLSTSEVNLR